MINIRPVSDLRNKYPEIEEQVKRDGPVFLTKNGYGSMVVMTVEQYSALTDEVEMKLDEIEKAAASTDVRYTLDEAFDLVRARHYEKQAL
ncbi:MAG: type II toxin-antitoxin system prevent-host-death family antitoxin [Clostridia bacterium]|nr:type II toxin-antitoxin system prevent-host-death family antitoxin [Clostridia bacterium]